MRTGLAAAALGICLGLTSPAPAQQQATSFWTGVNPRDLKFQTIDTRKAYRRFDSSRALRPPQQQRTFNLGNLFHSFTLPGWPPRRGVSKLPDPKKSPFT